MADEKIRLRFADDFVGETADIAQGEFRRRFQRADEPFEVTEDEARILLTDRDVFAPADESQALPADVSRLIEKPPVYDPSKPISPEAAPEVRGGAVRLPQVPARGLGQQGAVTFSGQAEPLDPGN